MLGSRRRGSAAEQRGDRLARRGLIEPAIFAAISIFVLSRPASAPGPSDELLRKEEEARQEAERARLDFEALGQQKDQSAEAMDEDSTRRRLAEAMRRLKEVEEELEAAESDLMEYPVPAYLKGTCRGGIVNIAITGASGVGKSSWVNAIRKLGPRDPGAAKTGVTETTQEPQMYKFPGPAGVVRRALNKVGSAFRSVTGGSRTEEDERLIQVGDRLMLQNTSQELIGEVATVVGEHEGRGEWVVKLNDGREMDVKKHQVTGVLADCVIWDLPGVGTPRFPQGSYLKNMGIRHFDMVVLMTASRFTEAELILVEELKKWNVPFFLVRNKADADVEAEIEREEEEEGRTFGDERKLEVENNTIKRIKDYFQEELNLNEVYCISTKRRLRDQFDFQKLEQDMERTLRRQRKAEFA